MSSIKVINEARVWEIMRGKLVEGRWGNGSKVIEGCRDKEKKGFHVLVFQTEAGFLDRQQESIKEFLRILEVHVSIAV
ncbi:hypothetical protein Tco_0179467 [Tanacetum coccineum]